MKKAILLLLFEGIFLLGLSQWHFHNPLPQGHTLRDVHFFDSNTGLAVGDAGTILRTRDGGQTWEFIATHTNLSLYSVTFISDDKGFACGDDGLLLCTEDGGESWEHIFSGFNYSFRDILAGPYPRIMAVGGEGVMILSEDGGLTWTALTSGVSCGLNSLYCMNAFTSWAVGDQGTILYSHDGGERWNPSESGTFVRLNKIMFTDENNGWIVGDQGILLFTKDGGEKWERQDLGIKDDLYGLCFCDLQTGWIVGSEGTILCTQDGGADWELQETDVSLPLLAVCSCSSKHGYAIGECGITLKTINGGSPWTTLSSGFYSGTLQYGGFTDDQHGWTCGWSGEIFHSEDEGITWTSSGSVPGYIGSMSDIAFSASDKGWFVSSGNWDDKNALLFTRDQGETWDTGYFAPGYWDTYCKISFVSPDTGWVGGMTIIEDPIRGFLMEYVVLRTYNGGQSWFRKIFKKPDILIWYTELLDIFFLDKKHGWAIGFSIGMNEYTGEMYSTRELLRTSNGGISWQIIPVDFDRIFQPVKIYFATTNIGWAYWGGGTIIYKTENGGRTWEEISFPGPVYDICFSDQDNGYFVSRNGNIYKTMDGGLTWTAQMSPTTYDLHRILFTESGNGWIYGEGSTILHLADTTTVGYEKVAFSPEAALHVYPNPFLESTIIAYELEETCRVNLSIYNYCGQLIDELVNEIKAPGVYQYVWPSRHIPPGVYVCKLIVNNQPVIKKLLRI